MPATALTIAGAFTMSGTASATAVAALSVGGNFTLGSGTAFTAGTYNHTVNGDFSNSGTFTSSTGTIILGGSTAQAIAGGSTTTFNNLTLSNASAAVSAAAPFNVSGTLARLKWETPPPTPR